MPGGSVGQSTFSPLSRLAENFPAPNCPPVSRQPKDTAEQRCLHNDHQVVAFSLARHATASSVTPPEVAFSANQQSTRGLIQTPFVYSAEVAFSVDQQKHLRADPNSLCVQR
eukprot:gene24432-10030_t